MIKLSENKTALLNLNLTIKALESVDYLIKEYQQDKVGPAYCTLEYVAIDHSRIQFDRKIMVTALQSQRQKLVEYLAELGIDASIGGLPSV